MALENEIEVVKAAREGDAGAFRELVNGYAADIYRLCVKLCGNTADAEDISQEVFVRMLKSIKNFDMKSRFSTWLYRIAVNRWIDVRRRRDRIKFSSLDEERADDDGELRKKEMPDPMLLPEQQIDGMETQVALAKALENLVPEQKLAIILKYKEGKSLEEISKICRMPVGTVSARISRGIKAMKKRMER